MMKTVWHGHNTIFRRILQEKAFDKFRQPPTERASGARTPGHAITGCPRPRRRAIETRRSTAQTLTERQRKTSGEQNGGAPARAQLKRVAWGKAEQRSERALALARRRAIRSLRRCGARRKQKKPLPTTAAVFLFGSLKPFLFLTRQKEKWVQETSLFRIFPAFSKARQTPPAADSAAPRARRCAGAETAAPRRAGIAR